MADDLDLARSRLLALVQTVINLSDSINSTKGNTMSLLDNADTDEEKKELSAPVATLNNGVKVANFCDPDTLIFMDGNALPGCHDKRVSYLAPKHKVMPRPGKKNTIDIHTLYENSPLILEEIKMMDSRADIDIVLVSVPVMEALKEWGYNVDTSKVRTKCFDKITRTIRSDQWGTGNKKVLEPESI